ncbi:MAG: ComEA family DNA-binding protein [Gammaproteobacteria bacterium]
MKILKRLVCTFFLFIPLTLLAADTVNINTADKETLMTVITGVGEKKADAIIEYREKNGPFKSIDELMNIKGIGQGTLDKHRNMLTVADS